MVKVTRKGQVTIPIEFRKRHRIREGGRVTFRAEPKGLVLVPMPSLEDLVGADAGKLTYAQAVRALDGLRAQDRD